MILPKSEPASRETIPASALYPTLQSRILTGHYPPGARIREPDLQHEFRTSNGPVREALQLAASDGLVERLPYRGVRVIDLGERQVVELFEVRQILLGAAAELAARRATAATLASAKSLRKRFRADAGGVQEIWLPGELSRWIFEHAGNPQLAETYRRPLLQSLIYVNTCLRKRAPIPTELNELVIALIDTIAEGKSAEARRATFTLTNRTLATLGLPPIAALDEDAAPVAKAR